VEIIRFAEIISAFSCVWSIWLNTRRKTAGWPIGLLSVILAAWVYFYAGLLAECGLQVFYFGSGIYGWQQWASSEKMNHEHRIEVQTLSRKEILVGVFIATIASVLIWMALQQTGNASSPVPDALLTGFSLLAQFWLARRKIENWLLWVGINLGSVLLYLQRELWFFAILYSVLLLLAFRGYSEWKKQWKAP